MVNDKLIIKEIILPISIEDAWKKWTTHDGLKTFFGRDNEIELKAGGKYEIYFRLDNPYGLRGSEDCKVLSFVPDKILTFSWSAPPEIPSIRNHEHKTIVSIFFHKLSDSSTKIELYHTGWLEGKEWELTFQYFDNAWDQVLNGFLKSCKNGNVVKN